MNLPPEIVAMIVGHLHTSADSRSLIACSRTSKLWRVETLPFLWQSKAVYHAGRLASFSPSHVHYIRNLLIACDRINWTTLASLALVTFHLNKLRFSRVFKDADVESLGLVLKSSASLKILSFEGAFMHCDMVDLLISAVNASATLETVMVKNCHINIAHRSAMASTFKTASNSLACDITSLSFKGTSSMTDSMLMELMRFKRFQSVRSLDLEQASICDWSMTNILPLLTRLTSLNLIGTRITDETVVILATPGIASQLVDLRLGDCSMKAKDLDARKVDQLVDALVRVECLYVAGCDISAETIVRFFQTHPDIRELDISESSLVQECFQGLLDNGAEKLFPRLRYLAVASCKILKLEGDVGPKTCLSPFSNFIQRCSGLEQLECSDIPRVRNAYIYGFRGSTKHAYRGNWSPEQQCAFHKIDLKRLRFHMTRTSTSQQVSKL